MTVARLASFGHGLGGARAAATFLLLLAAASPAAAQSLSLLDARVVEDNSGSAALVFEARLSAASANPVTFNFATGNGTAIAGDDYEARSLTGLSIPAGQTSLRIAVLVHGDTIPEANETLDATLGNVVGASVADANAKGLILNDDYALIVSSPHDPSAAASGSGGTVDWPSAISTSGRFIAFVSDGNDLAPGQPTNAFRDVYLRDLRTGLNVLVSVAANGGAANQDSRNPAVSADGRYVAFESNASNLVAQDGNGAQVDIFVRDLQTGVTSLVSVPASGTSGGNGFSANPGISSDGRYIVFDSVASNLVASDSNGATRDIFVRDRQAGTTTLVSRATNGTSSSNNESFRARISADGTHVAFFSLASDLVANDGNSLYDIFVRDLQAATTTRVSVAANGGDSNGSSDTPAISADGRFVAFVSWASNLGAPSAVNAYNVYVRDTEAGITELASYASDNVSALASGASSPTISDDGRYVAFDAMGAALPQDDNGFNDSYVRDRQKHATMLISQGYNGTPAVAGAIFPVISGDGRFLSLVSSATALAAGDGNGKTDAFRVLVPEDPFPPTMTLSDPSITEGDAGSKQLNFTVGLGSIAGGTISFDVDTADATAIAGSDYQAVHVSESIFAGESGRTISIDISGDTQLEPDEVFDIHVGNIRGAVNPRDIHALATIGNDDGGTPQQPSISVGDVAMAEGNSLSSPLTFTATLSATSTSAVSFGFATANGTATAGSDYVAKSQSGLTIPAGSLSKTFTVSVKGDTTVEPDETFLVSLAGVTGASVADGQAVGTISNDDGGGGGGTPALSIGNVSVSEGNSLSKQATFTVTLSAPASSAVSYNIGTANGTAVAPSDYTAKSLSGQSIPAGNTSKTFTVAIKGDTLVEPNETFSVNVSSVVGATVADGNAIGTITNDDGGGGPGPSLGIADVTIAEGNSLSRQATFTVTLSSPATTAVSYDIATANGTAVAPTDYTAKSLSGVSIAAGNTSKTFAVAIKGDVTAEPDETFTVNLSNVTGATVADGQATGTISNDDAAALSVARFDAGGLVDDVDDGNGQAQLASGEYATLLADGAATMCRRAPGATVIAVEGVEHKQVLADLADAANAICTAKPRYTAVMADKDRRGFLIELPGEGESGTVALGQPEANALAGSTALSIMSAGHATPVTVVLAKGASAALVQQLQQRAKARPQEALVLLGAGAASGFVDLTARQFVRSTPTERVFTNTNLLKAYGELQVELIPTAGREAPSQLLRLH
jgi:hypothetical protein